MTVTAATIDEEDGTGMEFADARRPVRDRSARLATENPSRTVSMSRMVRTIGAGVTALASAVCLTALSASGALAQEGAGTSRCVSATTNGADRQPPIEPSWDAGCVYATGFDDMSPSIQVTSDGSLFIARSVGGVLRSTDHGERWTALMIPNSIAGGGNSTGTHGYVHVDPRTDRVYYVTSMLVPSCGGLSGGMVSWSDDLGSTWAGTTVACDTFDWGKIVTGPAPAGNPYPSAAYFFGVGLRPVGGQRYVYRSLDGGATWQRMENPAAVTTEAGVGASAPDGTVYFDYPEFIGFDPARLVDPTYPFDPANLCRQMVAVSDDFGENWRQEPIPGSRTCYSLYGQQRVAVDRVGTVYALWVDDIDGQLYLSISRDRGRQWSAPTNIMPVGATFSHTHANIVAAEPGHVLIAALMTADPVDTRRAIQSNFSDYSSYLIESFDASNPTPHFTSVNLDSEGEPSVRIGEDHNEANAYLGMSPSGEGWAVFSRHAPALFGPGQLAVATMKHGAANRESPRPPHS